jgi:hypothetical protein
MHYPTPPTSPRPGAAAPAGGDLNPTRTAGSPVRTRHTTSNHTTRSRKGRR